MSGTPVADNAIQGPADLWVGVFGVTEPLATAIASNPGAGWTFVGGTTDGSTWTDKLSYSKMKFDQVAMPVGSRLEEREVSVKTNLAEPTLDMLVWALNGGANVAAAGPPATHTYTPVDSNAASVPTYAAVLLDGWSTGGKRRRLIVRKVLNIDGIETPYKRDSQTVFPVTFSGHWVSASIAPYIVTDQD
jgi:hypothetical protein